MSSPCNTPLYHVTLHVVLLPELVDVAHGGHGGELVAGSLTAAPPSRVSCSELVLLWGPSMTHCPHSYTPTISLGSYEIVHLNPKPSTLRNTKSLLWVKSCDLDIIHHHHISHYFIIFLLTKKLNYNT